MSGSRLLRVAVLLVGFAVFLQAYVGDLRGARYQDFGALYEAATLLARGAPDALYAHDGVDFAHAARGSTRRPFVQPPIVAEAARLALPLGMDRAGRALAAGITGFVNQSLTAFLLRQDLPFRESFSLLIHPLSPVWRTCIAVITLSAAAGAVMAYARVAAGRRDALLKSFAVLLVLLAPSVSWSHYYLFALAPLAHLATCARGDRGAWVALGIAVALMLRPLAPTTDPPDPSANFFASGFVLAACVLVALTGALAWQARVRGARAN